MASPDKALLTAFEREVSECLQVAIVHNLTDNFLRVGFQVSRKRVLLVFEIKRFPIDKDCESISEIEGEMYAYLPESIALDSIIFLSNGQIDKNVPMIVVSAI